MATNPIPHNLLMRDALAVAEALGVQVEQKKNGELRWSYGGMDRHVVTKGPRGRKDASARLVSFLRQVSRSGDEQEPPTGA